MLNAAIKNLIANKARLGLTALSVVLGVAFVTGTFIYRDTTGDAFDRIFVDAYDGIDIVVSGDSPLTSGQGVYFPQALADDIGEIDGVRAAFPTLQSDGVQIVVDGQSHVAFGGTQIGAYLPADPAAHLSVRLNHGEAPGGPDEVAIDATTATESELDLGDTVQIVTPTSTARDFTIVGIAGFGEDDDLGGASLALFDLPTAQALLAKPDRIDGALVLAASGVEIDDLIGRIEDIVPDRATVQTGAQAADEQAAELQDSLSFIYTFLLIFAFIALFVATFIIFNTFRIVMAQRTRELALFRALGATRGQVLRATMIEAALVGALASVAGVTAGIGVAAGLRRGMAGFGVDLPADRLVLAPVTVIVAVLAGIVSTVVSAALPAVRASRVAPLAAMRPDPPLPPPRRLRARTSIGLLIAATGGLLVTYGLAGNHPGVNRPLLFVAIGVATVMVATQVLAAPTAKVVTRVIGTLFARTSGVAGELARRNSGRDPRRTSATAAAIIVATALIAMANVMANSFRAAVDEVIDQGIEADFIAGGAFAATGFSSEVADVVLELEEFESATRLQFGTALLDGEEDFIGGIDNHFADFLTLDRIEGNLDLDNDEALVVEGPGGDQALGETIIIQFEEGDPVTFTVAAVASGKALTGTFISRDAYNSHIGPGEDRQVFFTLAPGVSLEQGKAALDTVTDRFPTVAMQTSDELQSEVEEQITQSLGLITALLGLTVIIALIGVANTMTLAVHERTREIGLLRAVGLSRRDTRRMILAEASIITLFGTGLGLAVGVFSAWAVLLALKDLGFTTFAVPVPALVASIATAAILAVGFAMWPARTAARLDILLAINR